MQVFSVKTALLALSMASVLTGCGGDNQDTILPAEYTVSVSNMSNFQPISPIGLGLHADGHWFEIGEAASLALEKLAEGGDNSELLATAVSSMSMSGPLLPGATQTLRIEKGFGNYRLSAIGMLVNTNDAFTALDAVELEGMAVGEQKSFDLAVYDAGTEANSEAAGTIPGPADGGEGFNALRDDKNVVSMHSGVVTKDDGLATSVLTEQARFDNPVLHLVLTRTK